MTMTATIQLGGNTYQATVTTTLKSKAKAGAQMKK